MIYMHIIYVLYIDIKKVDIDGIGNACSWLRLCTLTLKCNRYVSRDVCIVLPDYVLIIISHVLKITSKLS